MKWTIWNSWKNCDYASVKRKRSACLIRFHQSCAHSFHPIEHLLNSSWRRSMLDLLYQCRSFFGQGQRLVIVMTVQFLLLSFFTSWPFRDFAEWALFLPWSEFLFLSWCFSDSGRFEMQASRISRSDRYFQLLRTVLEPTAFVHVWYTKRFRYHTLHF